MRTRGEEEGLEYANNALCLDMENFYIAGEPRTNFEASVIIDFEYTERYERLARIRNDNDEDDYYKFYPDLLL